MAISNAYVSALLRRYAGMLLEVERADRFKIKAYRRAADTIDFLDHDVGAMVAADEDLTKLPGIGKALAQTIEQIVHTGRMPQLDNVSQQMDPAQAELLSRPTLDTRKALRVYKTWNPKVLLSCKTHWTQAKLGTHLVLAWKVTFDVDWTIGRACC